MIVTLHYQAHDHILSHMKDLDIHNINKISYYHSSGLKLGLPPVKPYPAEAELKHCDLTTLLH